jgi:hypothetical protein
MSCGGSAAPRSNLPSVRSMEIFNESVLERPLEYVAEGVVYCAERYIGSWDQKNEQTWDASKFPYDWLVSYERYLIQIGLEKPPNADGILQAMTPKRFISLTWLLYSLHSKSSLGNSERVARFHSVPFIRDLFGNPFKRVIFKEVWQSGTVVSLSKPCTRAEISPRCQFWPMHFRILIARIPTFLTTVEIQSASTFGVAG